MIPSIKFDRTIVAVRVGEVVNVLVELTAPPAAPVGRAPLDVVVVLDRSGSMGGAPLAAVTAATAQLLRLAGADDRIGVVAFDDTVQLVLPLAHQDADSAGRVVRAIRSGGSTNLSGGWLKGLEMLATAQRPDALRRIVILTDGHANAGIVDHDELVPLISSGRKQGVTTSATRSVAKFVDLLRRSTCAQHRTTALSTSPPSPSVGHPPLARFSCTR